MSSVGYITHYAIDACRQQQDGPRLAILSTAAVALATDGQCPCSLTVVTLLYE